MSRALGFCLGLMLALGGSPFGRDAAAAEPPEARPAAGAAQDGGDKPPGGSAPDAQPPLRQEHVIYLPYEKLRDVFEKEDSSIVLPYGQFLEMWNRLVRPERPPTQPPASGVITRADYKGAVSGQLARLEATLDLESLSDEWARLPLQFGDAAIASARAEDGDVLLGGAGQGRYELLVRGKGKHRITLGLVVGVKSAAEGRSFTVECPTVGVSNLELEIPEKELAIEVAPRRTSELQTEKDATRLRAALGATDRFTVSWQPKSGGLDEAGGLANVTDTIAVDVGDGVVHTHAVFDYQVLRGSLGELVVEVPLDERLLDVQAAGLRDWRTETAGDRQRITIRLHAPATGSVRLELHTETPISEEAFQVGRVRAVGAARESGILAVRGAEDVGLEYPLRESLTRIDAAEAPETLR
ncbi:MAG: hypothetical protein GXY25_14910, partial [Pirellulaceae bacterium]|nr:hypothetical protein [Pirellulaceae bacterium]